MKAVTEVIVSRMFMENLKVTIEINTYKEWHQSDYTNTYMALPGLMLKETKLTKPENPQKKANQKWPTVQAKFL